MDTLTAAYKGLNKEQLSAVESLDGPVMVIAGPGTGKTQVLTVRIAHILSTVGKADEILCLTFTNAGVKAMRERLLELIGPTATKVKITTFHSFGLELIEQYHNIVGFERAPALLDDGASVALFDQVLHSREWKYLRPRSNGALYYLDLKSLISTLKRDGVSPLQFEERVHTEILRIQKDPESLSSRGESKGQIKKEVQKKIESLERSREAAQFYEAYENLKRVHGSIDYNDVLTLMVAIAQENDSARSDIQERFQYILIDEHQDSSGVQNAFLAAVWGEVERPNIFVVGDDRQLIYGFGGASLAHFEAFKHAFGAAKRITLTENYRSTQTILDSAEALLTSDLAQGKLTGSTREAHPIRLIECEYPRDEIIAAGLDIKAKIAEGIDPNNCVILVPKNRQVKSATILLRDMGLPVASSTSLTLFEQADTQFFLMILRVLVNPYDAVALSRSIFDPHSGIPILAAHAYMHSIDTRTLSIEALLAAADESVVAWGTKLSSWLTLSKQADSYAVIQQIGDEVFLKQAKSDEGLRKSVEVIRTLLNLVSALIERPAVTTTEGALRGNTVDVSDFLNFITRLESYGEDIPLAVFGAGQGVKVLTLHGSKGLQFDAVWIAHMDERSLVSRTVRGFVIPQTDDSALEEESEAIAKRQLYVAITRAKRFCTISYARRSHAGADQTLASIIAALPQDLFVKEQQHEVEDRIVADDPRHYIARVEAPFVIDEAKQLADIVKSEYSTKKISVTTLNTFFECTWKWYFRNLLLLPESMSESLYVGDIVHKTIEYILAAKNTANATKEHIDMHIARIATKTARYDDTLAAHLAHEARTIITLWQKTHQPMIAPVYEIEQSYAYQDPQYPHLTVTGKIDLIEEVSSNEVRVTDWKTGGVKTTAMIEKDTDEGRMSPLLRQLAMYSYLISGATKDAKAAVESRLVFIEAKEGDSAATHMRHITLDDIERLRKDIYDYDTLLKSGEWMREPCHAKAYREGDICEYCALAEKMKLR